jgi:secondary thiamine-phosphate synthase enzyme
MKTAPRTPPREPVLLRIEVQTPPPVAFVEISNELNERLRHLRAEFGVLLVRVRHTTAAIVTTEGDPTVHRDAFELLDRLVPLAGIDYHHTYEGTDNARAHQRALLLGTDAWVPVSEGRLQLGTWQRLFLVELWASMVRELDVTFIPAEPSK